MPDEIVRLPLFPLNVVMFPNTSIPLQIFEERYKQMLRDCLDGDSRFGVTLIKEGAEVGDPATPHSVGTVADIVHVNRVAGDRFFISIFGRERFEIVAISQQLPYLAADVRLLEDEAEVDVPPTEMAQIRKAATEHVRLRYGLSGGWVRESRLPTDPLDLSYFIGGMLQADLQEKQALLAEPSTSKRLETELDLLRREGEELRKQVTQQLRSRFSRQ